MNPVLQTHSEATLSPAAPSPAAPSFRLQRLRDTEAQAQQQFIAFQLHQTHFLLPMAAAYRAIQFDPPQTAHQVEFEGRILTAIDGQQRIIGEASATPMRIALVVQNVGGDRIVLPIDTAPNLCRIQAAHFVPLPKTYRMRCVAAMTKAAAEFPFRFLLDPEQLIET